MNRQSMYSTGWFNYAYAPYNFFSRYNNTTIDKDCYFLVEFYFLVDFLKKKLPLEIVQFIFTIVKEKQEKRRALHVANSNYRSNDNLYSSPIPFNRPIIYRYIAHFECLKYHDSDEVTKAKLSEALFGHSSLPKKNKKQWVQEKKEKLSKSKNRYLKR